MKDEVKTSDNKLLAMNISPHVFDRQTTKSIMRDVFIALVPAMLASFYFFGMRALLVLLASLAGCIISEIIFKKLVKKDGPLLDGSATVTAVLFAFCSPATLPLYMVVFGAAAGIIVGKMVFGGLGYNIFNPALVGRAIVMASWTNNMTTWPAQSAAFLGVYDAVTRATPLAGLKSGEYAASYIDLFIGNVGGSLGETSALLILLGGLFLIFRNVIKPVIPASFIGTVFVFSYLLGIDPVYSILAGGVFLGAFFMATDYVTSPISFNGRLIFGIGCGLLTVMIRKFGGYPEGVCYAILFMNGLVPLIDRYTKPRVFGGQVR